MPPSLEKEFWAQSRINPTWPHCTPTTSVLSPSRGAWAAWNYECPRPGLDPEGVATLTYDMTALQRLPGARRYLVSLNSDHRIDPGSVIASFTYSHPVFDGPAIAAQRRFDEIDGAAAPISVARTGATGSTRTASHQRSGCVSGWE